MSFLKPFGKIGLISPKRQSILLCFSCLYLYYLQKGIKTKNHYHIYRNNPLNSSEVSLVYGGAKSERQIQLTDKCKADINQGVSLGATLGVTLGATSKNPAVTVASTFAGMMVGQTVATGLSSACKELKQEVDKSKNGRFYVTINGDNNDGNGNYDRDNFGGH